MTNKLWTRNHFRDSMHDQKNTKSCAGLLHLNHLIRHPLQAQYSSSIQTGHNLLRKQNKTENCFTEYKSICTPSQDHAHWRWLAATRFHAGKLRTSRAKCVRNSPECTRILQNRPPLSLCLSHLCPLVSWVRHLTSPELQSFAFSFRLTVALWLLQRLEPRHPCRRRQVRLRPRHLLLHFWGVVPIRIDYRRYNNTSGQKCQDVKGARIPPIAEQIKARLTGNKAWICWSIFQHMLSKDMEQTMQSRKGVSPNRTCEANWHLKNWGSAHRDSRLHSTKFVQKGRLILQNPIGREVA